MSEFLGKLHECAVKFPMTDIWMDSCGEEELEYGMVDPVTYRMDLTQEIE